MTRFAFTIAWALVLVAASAIESPLRAQRPQPAAATAAPASPDETARFLAGLPARPGSSLAGLTGEAAWRAHAAALDREWASLEAKQLNKVRAFSAAHLKSPSKTLFYTFSGPDFVYANAFFPNATTYVLAGLEPVGPIPDVARLRPGSLGAALDHLRTSIRHLLGFSYFITLDMDRHLRSGQMPGVLPILFVFMARSDKTIRNVEHLRLLPDGKIVSYSDGPATRDVPRAVRITFAGADNVERTLYYFSTNLENKGIAASGFIPFIESLGPGDAFIKSASYLLHGSAFSRVRDLLLARSVNILQDDSGIPVRYFDEKVWTLQPHGRYTTPIPVFKGQYQPQLKALFDKGKPPPFDFSLGYRWRPGQSNLLHAQKK